MKVILIANISANGKILLAGNPHHQAPDEAIGFFVQRTIQAGNLVIGRKTFDVIQQFPGGIKQIFPGVEIVLLSTSPNTPHGVKTVHTPDEAIQHLTAKGFTEIVIGGGTLTYNAFLDGQLVTDVYLGIVPMITGSGGILGPKAELTTNFKLVDHKLLADNLAQLHLSKI